MDKDWAPFMRIHPIIDWNYEQVWTFLKDFDIPYCPLYDQGYLKKISFTNFQQKDIRIWEISQIQDQMIS